MSPAGLQAPPRGPPKGARAPKGIVNRGRDIVSPMRTHTYSIAIAHLQSGDWTVAIVQTTFKQGQVVDQELSYGPIWMRESALAAQVLRAVEVLQRLVLQDEETNVGH